MQSPSFEERLVRRRAFIVGVAASISSLSTTSDAEENRGIKQIAVVLPYPESDPQSKLRIAILESALSELAWIEGRNFRFNLRWNASSIERIRAHAIELLSDKPDVILANSTPVTVGLVKENIKSPLIFVSVADPVGAGLVSNFPHPGGNITGFVNIEPTMGGKWVELLKEVAPATSRALLLLNPELAPTNTDSYVRSIRSAGATLGVKTDFAPVHNAGEIEAVIGEIAGQPDGGLLIMLDIFVTAQRQLINSLAERYHLPAVWPVPFFGEEGGLIAYGTDISDLFRRAASYIDRILHGEQPAALPVQLPIKFEMVINLKTARSLGLVIPQSLLLRADKVIE